MNGQRSRVRSRGAHGFTLLQVVAGLAAVFALSFLGGLLVPGLGGKRGVHRSPTDAMQVRALIRGHLAFAQSTGGVFVLPSEYDRDNRRWIGEPETKDTTANIAWVMCEASLIPPEVLVSPGETNPAIRVYTGPLPLDHEPSRTLTPSLACDFTTGIGNVSYAHLQPSGERRSRWNNSAGSGDPILGNRGPEIERVDVGAEGERAILKDSRSLALRNGLSERGVWRGWMAYGDASARLVDGFGRPVDTGESVSPPKYHFGPASGLRPDHLFFDEPDDVRVSANAYLGLFVKAGATPGQFRAIWD